jgi:hypothetical protein
MMSTETRYLVVRTTTRYAGQVPAYLYATAELLPQRVQQTAERTVLLVRVTDAPGHAESTARYQAGRLDSGGHYSAVHATRADALADMSAALLQEI